MSWITGLALRLCGRRAVASLTPVGLLLLCGGLFAQGGSDPLHTVVFSDGRVGGIEALSSAEAELAKSSRTDPFRGSGSLSAADRAESLRGFLPSAGELGGLPPLLGGPDAESIIGVDTRMRVADTRPFPARATALITFDGGGWCTGWFYRPNVVATAGQCVHTGGSKGVWRRNVRVWPGYDAGAAPYGSYPAKWTAAVLGWTRDANERYDYGVIKLYSNVGNTVGWYGLWWQNGSLNDTGAELMGYPGDKSPRQSMWVAGDKVRVTSAEQLFYFTDAVQSGGAVWTDDRPAGSSVCGGGPCAFAIHTLGPHPGPAPHNTHNHGTRITYPVYINLLIWSLNL